MVDQNRIQDLIARPTEEGTFKKSYFYGGRKFFHFPEAMKARAEALDEAGIWNISESEIRDAETAIKQRGGKNLFLGQLELFTRVGQKKKLSPGAEIRPSQKPSGSEYAFRPDPKAGGDGPDRNKDRLDLKNAFIWLGIGIFSFQIVSGFGMLPESYLGQGVKTLHALALTLESEFIPGVIAGIIVTVLLPLPTALIISIKPKNRNLDSLAKNYRIWHKILAAFAALSLVWFF